MFQVKNTTTGRFIKDAITGKIWRFETAALAQKWADNLHNESVTRPRSFRQHYFSFIVVKI